MLPDPSRERVFYTMTKFNICTRCSERGFGSGAFSLTKSENRINGKKVTRSLPNPRDAAENIHI